MSNNNDQWPPQYPPHGNNDYQNAEQGQSYNDPQATQQFGGQYSGEQSNAGYDGSNQQYGGSQYGNQSGYGQQNGGSQYGNQQYGNHNNGNNQGYGQQYGGQQYSNHNNGGNQPYGANNQYGNQYANQYGQNNYGQGYGHPGGPTPPQQTPWYKKPLVWIITGVVAIAAIVGGYFLLRGDDSPTADPTTTEPTTDEPTTDEPTTDEPTTDEPTTDEPTTDEPTTDEPTTDEPDPAPAPSGEIVMLGDGEAAEGPSLQVKPAGNERLTTDLIGDPAVCVDIEVTATGDYAMASGYSFELRNDNESFLYSMLVDEDTLGIESLDNGDTITKPVCFTAPAGSYTLVYQSFDAETFEDLFYGWNVTFQ